MSGSREIAGRLTEPDKTGRKGLRRDGRESLAMSGAAGSTPRSRFVSPGRSTPRQSPLMMIGEFGAGVIAPESLTASGASAP